MRETLKCPFCGGDLAWEILKKPVGVSATLFCEWVLHSEEEKEEKNEQM